MCRRSFAGHSVFVITEDLVVRPRVEVGESIHPAQKFLQILVSLHEIDFTGSISTFGEGIARITLVDDKLEGVSTRTDLILDGERIRCSVLNNGIFYLNFVAFSDNRLFVQDIQRDVDPMDALTTAQQVVDRMLNIIEWTRG